MESRQHDLFVRKIADLQIAKIHDPEISNERPLPPPPGRRRGRCGWIPL
jgi:hypothetical protein